MPLHIHQPSRGYRYSVDALLLADFARPLCGRRVLDLGTGSGIVLLYLARACPGLDSGVGVEIQRDLFECARRNIEEGGFSGRLTAVLGDLRGKIPGIAPGSFDLVVSNPPYRKAGEGRRNPDTRKEIARHEVACTLRDLFRAAGRYMAPKGKFAMVGLAGRLPEILENAASAGIAPETVRFVHPFPDAPANRVLFAGSRRRAGGPQVLPPLVEYSEKGRYTTEVERIVGGRAGR